MDYDDLFNLFPKPPTKRPSPEKGVQLHAKEIGGVVYVRADDIAALLEINAVLPKASALLRKRVAKKGA